MSTEKDLLSVIELGGYPNFTSLYERAGFRVHLANSVRNANRMIKKIKPSVVVAEFNFQSDFRDRTSSLESLLSTVQWLDECSVIVFYEKEYDQQLRKLQAQYDIYTSIAFPVDTELLGSTLESLADQTG